MHKIACRLTRILQVRISLHQEPRSSEFVCTRKNVLLVVRFEGYVLDLGIATRCFVLRFISRNFHLSSGHFFWRSDGSGLEHFAHHASSPWVLFLRLVTGDRHAHAVRDPRLHHVRGRTAPRRMRVHLLEVLVAQFHLSRAQSGRRTRSLKTTGPYGHSL